MFYTSIELLSRYIKNKYKMKLSINRLYYYVNKNNCYRLGNT